MIFENIDLANLVAPSNARAKIRRFSKDERQC